MADTEGEEGLTGEQLIIQCLDLLEELDRIAGRAAARAQSTTGSGGSGFSDTLQQISRIVRTGFDRVKPVLPSAEEPESATAAAEPLIEGLTAYGLVVKAQLELTAREREILEAEGELERHLVEKTASLKRRIARLLVQVSEGKKRERQLEGSLRASRGILKYIPVGILIFQYQPPSDLFLIEGNPEAFRQTEIDPQDCRGRELDELWPNARREGLTEALLHTAGTGKPFHTDRAHFRSGKVDRTFRLKAFRLRGKRLGVVFEAILEYDAP